MWNSLAARISKVDRVAVDVGVAVAGHDQVHDALERVFGQEGGGGWVHVPRTQVQQSAGIGVLAGEAQAGYPRAGLLNRHAVGIVASNLIFFHLP
jgi:hypothetical protein